MKKRWLYFYKKYIIYSEQRQKMTKKTKKEKYRSIPSQFTSMRGVWVYPWRLEQCLQLLVVISFRLIASINNNSRLKNTVGYWKLKSVIAGTVSVLLRISTYGKPQWISFVYSHNVHSKGNHGTIVNRVLNWMLNHLVKSNQQLRRIPSIWWPLYI